MAAARSWSDWQDLWDRQQAGYLPDREERLHGLVTLVEQLCGCTPRVLDLACGCGSISRRLFDRLPGATAVGLDVDPVLLRIAAGSFEGDDRIFFVEADLRRPDWPQALEGTFDAALTATALHWLGPGELAGLYGALPKILRPGGLFANADHMPGRDTPRLGPAARALRPATAEGAPTWEDWWRAVQADPRLGPLLLERNRRFGGELHPREFTPPPTWHLEVLRAAGFAEASVVWRRGSDAIAAAVTPE